MVPGQLRCLQRPHVGGADVDLAHVGLERLERLHVGGLDVGRIHVGGGDVGVTGVLKHPRLTMHHFDGRDGEPMSRTTTRRANPSPRSTGSRAAATIALAGLVLGTGAGIARADTNPALGYDPVADKGSLYNVERVVGAHDLYAAGLTGKGVGVALIDTGVAPVPGLTSGNVVDGPDLSLRQPGRDAWRTSTASATARTWPRIIAGRDAAGTPSSYLDPTHLHGDRARRHARRTSRSARRTVPSTSPRSSPASTGWCSTPATDHIRVINLAYGTDSVQSSMVDPLAYAVENAWKHGIVVVAAGGNDGDVDQDACRPGLGPARASPSARMDDAGTVDPSDDTVPYWSTRGTTPRHVDVVAPGVSVLGLRDPGSTVDVGQPAGAGRRPASRGAAGTVQAAAVVGGEAALLLQARPGPDPGPGQGAAA